MADLTNRSVASSYKELLKTASASGVTSALTTVEDGDATASALQISSAGVKSGGFLTVDGSATFNSTATVAGTLSGQSLSLAQNLTVNGTTNLQGNLGVGGSVTVTNNLTVLGVFSTTGGALATQQGTEVLTNKTINLAQNTLQATSAQLLTSVGGTLDLSAHTAILPLAAAPAQTADGSVVWDTDDNLLTVGTGSGRKTMVDTDSAQTLTNKTMVISPTITLGTHLTGSLTLTNLAGGTLNASMVPNSTVQKIEVSRNSTAAVGAGRKRINFIEGSNVNLTLADDSANDRLNLIISVPGGGGGGGGGGGSATDIRDIWLLS